MHAGLPQFMHEVDGWLEIRERLSICDNATLKPALEKVDEIIAKLVAGVQLNLATPAPTGEQK